MNESSQRYDTDSVREYTVSDADAGPYALAEGPDGALWFTEWGTGRVGRITVDGRLGSYALSRADSEPHGITVHGGALWCALESGSLARIEVPS
ncbi:streptogramin lyase [Streptomyces tendae]